MRVVLHAQRELARAIQERELAKLRMDAVHLAQARSGRHDVRASKIVRIAYHQSSLAVLVAKARHCRWHIAMHRHATGTVTAA